MLDFDGEIFPDFARRQNYNDDSRRCITETVEGLIAEATTGDRPGILLGKVQSGKTRTFLGVISLAFDNGYDVAVVLTKGTKSLARQTLVRLNTEFRPEVEKDLLHIFDVMQMPSPLSEYELAHKIVIVCKKEDDNIRRLNTAFFTVNPALSQRKVLIIDDEADFASLGFKRTRQEGIKINKIASQISDIRSQLPSASFLQVTATPYSLYLQPKDIVVPGNLGPAAVFRPIRPAFTVVLPEHSEYVGGDYYFRSSQNEGHVASFLHVDVPSNELDTLKRQDRRTFKIEECLTADAVSTLRRAIVTFVLGGWVRRWQESRAGQRPPKYSFIVHTETGRQAHNWQEEVVHRIVADLRTASSTSLKTLKVLVSEAFKDLSESISAGKGQLPDEKEALKGFIDSLRDVTPTRINSDNDVIALLDDSGQLKLRTPFNIFIGGQILDRGVTIDNLIGFFYGRNPQRFQQDTVLQHARMFGRRAPADLTVTRFYTTRGIWNVMRRIHEFDSALRDAFQSGGHEKGVVFLRSDATGTVIPCSPNKILLSTVTTVRPNSRFLPVGFLTDAKSRAMKHVRKVDEIVAEYDGGSDGAPFLLPRAVAEEVIDEIRASLVMDADSEWDIAAFKAVMAHLSGQRDQVACLARRNRNLAKYRPSGRLQDAPESAADSTAIQGIKGDLPSLFLFRQNGRTGEKWAGCEFWWPVLVAPGNVPPVIFAGDTVD